MVVDVADRVEDDEVEDEVDESAKEEQLEMLERDCS